MGKPIDMTGWRFGRLVCLSYLRQPGSTRAFWKCQCDCGNVKKIDVKNLRPKTGSRSCGCANRERASQRFSDPVFKAESAIRSLKHGQKRGGSYSTGPEYKTWLGMKSRCNNPKNKDYPNWGGRGIRVCEEWNESFVEFLAHVGPRPTLEHQIDRLDSNKDYEPGNCRWVTAEVQGGKNKRTNMPLKISGLTYPTITAASRSFGIGVTTILDRLQRGATPEQAITKGRIRINPRDRESYLRKSHPDRASGC